MKIQKMRPFWAVTVGILFFLIIAATANAQAIKTTVGDILSNPDQYDGKMVQIEGNVTSVNQKVSKKGNSYFILKIANGDKSLSVFNFGRPSIKEGDSAKVTGRYQKVKHVGQYTFYNEIDASRGSVEKL